MLLPVYLLYPLYYKWHENGNRTNKTVHVLCILIMASLAFYLFISELYTHLSQVFNTILLFLIGEHYAQSIYKKEFKFTKIFIFSIAFFIFKLILSRFIDIDFVNNLSMALLGIAGIVVFTFILDRINLPAIHNTIDFLGKLSLEIYLTNIFLLQAYTYFGFDMIIPNNILITSLVYLLIAIVGVILSWCTPRVLRTKKINNYK